MKVQSIIRIPEAEAKTGGTLKDFVWDRMMEGDFVSYENDQVILKGVDASIQSDFANLVAVVVAGGYFEGIVLAFTLTAEATSTLVPALVPGATYTDEEGIEQQRTFVQWAQANAGLQVIQHTSGTPFIVKGKWGSKLLDSDALTAINGVVGAQVIEWAEAVAAYQSEDYTIFEL